MQFSALILLDYGRKTAFGKRIAHGLKKIISTRFNHTLSAVMYNMRALFCLQCIVAADINERADDMMKCVDIIIEQDELTFFCGVCICFWKVSFARQRNTGII